MKHTIRDVARLAGVSVSTVSAVINGSVKVSEYRTAKVKAALEALDFHPDHFAQSLKLGKSKTIGVVVPDITNAFYPELIRGIEESAQKAGYSVILCDSNEDFSNEKEHLDLLFVRRVDGVILACTAGSLAFESHIQQRFPLVFVDRSPPLNRNVPVVTTDNRQAAVFATNHLISLGHRRIAFLAGHAGISAHASRLEGFRDAMQSANLAILRDYIQTGDMEPESACDSGRRLLDLPDRPTAIIASNNKLLLGLLSALNEFGIHCPSELSVIGFDDYIWNEHFSPKLTAVAQPVRQMGREAFNLLLCIMEGNDCAPSVNGDSTMLLPAELRIRQSTAAPPPL